MKHGSRGQAMLVSFRDVGHVFEIIPTAPNAESNRAVFRLKTYRIHSTYSLHCSSFWGLPYIYANYIFG